jgi:hypothetical protein
MGDDRPLGMTEEEFQEAKARHEAGELTLGEVELLREQLEARAAAASEGAPADDESKNPEDDAFESAAWQARLGQRIEF